MKPEDQRYYRDGIANWKKKEKRKGIERKEKRASKTGSGLDLKVGRRGEHRELASGAGPIQLLPTDRSVVDDGGDFDIIGGALPGLVGRREPPRPGSALGVDDQRVVRASTDDIGFDAGDLGGLDQDPGTATVILDDGVVGQTVDLQTALEAVDTSPHQAITLGRPSEGVVRATRELGDIAPLERLHQQRVHNGSFIIASALSEGGGTKAVQAPSVDLARFTDGESVI